MRDRDYLAEKRHYIKHGSPKPPPARRVCEHPECGREIGVYTPAKGDGSLDYYRRHKLPNGDPCPLSARPVPSDERIFR